MHSEHTIAIPQQSYPFRRCIRFQSALRNPISQRTAGWKENLVSFQWKWMRYRTLEQQPRSIFQHPVSLPWQLLQVWGVSPGRPYTHRRTPRGAPGPRRSGTSAGLCHRFGISAAAPAKREDASNILAKVCRNRSIKNVLSCTSWSFMAPCIKKIDCLVDFRAMRRVQYWSKGIFTPF